MGFGFAEVEHLSVADELLRRERIREVRGFHAVRANPIETGLLLVEEPDEAAEPVPAFTVQSELEGDAVAPILPKLPGFRHIGELSRPRRAAPVQDPRPDSQVEEGKREPPQGPPASPGGTGTPPRRSLPPGRSPPPPTSQPRTRPSSLDHSDGRFRTVVFPFSPTQKFAGRNGRARAAGGGPPPARVRGARA